MASMSTGAKVEKLSFAKVAAAGLKPPTAPQTAKRAESSKKQDIPLPSSDSAQVVSPSRNSNQLAFTPNQMKIVALAPSSAEKIDTGDANGPEVHVQIVQTTSPDGQAPRALDGMLLPAAVDEAGTQASSSDSVKPPSLDGKSVTSGTTFALDEKESLRPDDSASVKAREEEDVFSPPDLSLPESQISPDEEMRAFRDQLREISGMDAARPPIHPEGFGHNGLPAQGVLYVPPQGPGVGNVPGSSRDPVGMDQGIDFPPDPKLLEALDSPKDRIMVLKLEQDIVDFLKDAKETSLKLPQTNTFYRMLAHKLADYYMLGHGVDESTMAVRIFKTPNCRLPPPLTGIATPSTAASTPPPGGPQMKILRRGVDSAGPTIANGSNVTSKTTSENGESGNEDDKKAKSFTREEREARYEAARKRIMGSAKPSESPEEAFEIDNSRSSSAAGRRSSRKKQRADSDDDFEARSAYSAYYPVPMATPTTSVSNTYGASNVVPSHGHQFSPAPYSGQAIPGNYSPYSGQPSNAWSHPPPHAQQGPPNWMQQRQTSYDLPGEFQRAMSFQSSPLLAPNPAIPSGYGAHYNQQISTPQQAWPHQSAYMASYAAQGPQNVLPGYPTRTPPMPSQPHEVQPYMYGQLPSQAFPGRPPSKLEHPLPGSYKSKHFNPQSQSFIPGQPSMINSIPFQPAPAPPNHPPYGPGYGLPATPQSQNSAMSPNVMAGPQSAVPGTAIVHPSSQPMTHPLPQPVFPRQPSPNVPLPPKPAEIILPKASENINGPAIVSSTPAVPNPSSIAKWSTSTPASLPAKPPPLAEAFDSSRFAPSQRQSSGSSRLPGNMPIFGSMPAANAGVAMNGQNLHSPRQV